MAPPSDGASGARTGIAALGASALAIGCCAAAPLVLAALGGVALGAILGVAGGVLAVAALLALVPLIRRRRSCERPGAGDSGRSGHRPASE
jgi:zinc transporter ZupT